MEVAPANSRQCLRSSYFKTKEGGSVALNPAQLLKAITFAADKQRHERRKDA
jgi:hypothetical protein